MDLKKTIYDCLKSNLPAIQKEREENLSNWRKQSNHPRKKIVLFGASAMGEICIRHLEHLGINVDVICDNNSSRFGEFMTDTGRTVKILSVEEALSDIGEKLCFVATGAQHFPSISAQLQKYEWTEPVLKWHLDFYLETMIMICTQSVSFMERVEELLNFYQDEESLKILWGHFAMLFQLLNVPDALKSISLKNLCIRPQYFLGGGKYMAKQEIMVDCGAYIGDTLEDLIYNVKYYDFRQYDCYEMLPVNYQELRKTVDRLPDELQKRIRTYNVGVGEDSATVNVSSGNGECKVDSRISRNGDMAARIRKLDDIYADGHVSFIKMDIEGSEQAALRGGKNTISKCRPMCAVCVYHSLSAFWEVPRLLKEYVPEYALILRHHTTDWDDTVCYAKIGEWE